MINNIGKDFLNKSGIYIVTNTINHKVYIGSAELLRRRRSQHLHRLKNGTHQSKHMQSHFNKYGADSLVFSVLELCDIDAILDREQFYLDKYKPFVNNGFNTARIAGATNGYKHTEEAKKEMSIRKKGIKKSKEFCELQSINGTGRKHTPESFEKMFKAQANPRMNMSLAKKGLKLSENHLEALKNKKKHPSKNVIVFNTETGIFYNNIREASETYPKFGLAAFYKRISGNHYNNTSFTIA